MIQFILLMLRYSNRSFLKLTKMTLKSIATSVTIEASIKQRQRPAPAASPMLASALRSSIEPRSAPAAAPIPASARLANESRWASSKRSKGPLNVSSDSEEVEMIEPAFDPKPELESQRKDIDRILETVSNLRGDIGPPFDPKPELESQRKEIDRILETVSNLQQGPPFDPAPELESQRKDIDRILETVSNLQQGPPFDPASELESQRKDIDRILETVSNLQQGPPFDPAPELESQRKDIDRILETVSNLQQGPPFDPVPELESQRKDIDRIVETVSNLQGDMDFIKDSISNFETRQPGAFAQTQNFAEEIDILTENVSKFSKGLSEVEGLKFDIKMIQQRLKRLEEDRLRKRTSLTAAEHTQDPTRFSTPMPAVKASPQPTPRNHTGLFRENFLNSRDPFPRNPSRTFSEMPSGGHPLRNEHQFSNDYDDMNGNYEPYEDSRPSNHQTLTDTTRGNANGETYPVPPSNTAEMPPPRPPYTPLDPRLSDTPQSSTNGYAESLPRPAPTAHATKPTNHPILTPGVQEASTVPRYPSEGPHVSDSEQVDTVQPQPQYPPPPQMPAPQAQMVSNSNKRRHRRTSVPTRLPTPPGWQGTPGTGAETNTEPNRSKRRKTTAFGETSPGSLSSPAPATSSEAANARKSPSSSGLLRNEKGLLFKTNGKIDGRSMRYLSQNKEKRIHRPTQGPRDAEGYLLRPDGTRDARSVRIIDEAKRKKAEAGQTESEQTVAG